MGIVNYTYNRSTSGGEIITHLINGTDGQGLHFDGAAGNIDIATPPDLGTKFSFEFIVQASSFAAGVNKYYVDFEGSGARFVFGNVSSQSDNLAIYDDLAWRVFSPAVKVVDDLVVHHLVVTVDGTTATLYDNGNQIATATGIGAHNIDGATDAAIGSSASAAHSWFNGTFYRARFWNKTLTQAEVTASFEQADVPFADQYGSQTNKISATVDQTWSAAQADTGNDVNDRATFDAAYGWTAYNNIDISVASNVYQFSTSITTTGTYKYIGIVGGKKYRFTVGTGTITGNTYTAYAGGIGAGWAVGDLVASTTNIFEFTAAAGGNGYIYILSEDATAGTIQLDASSVSNEIVEIGAVADYDLAFANPTQSLMVQDRAGAADGTASATGVSQVTPIEQLNSKAARIGTTAATPADGELLVSGDVLIGDGSADIVGYNRALTVATHTAGQISAIELVSHQNGDADLSGVEFVNDTTRVASIFASRSGADNSGKLSLATVNAGVFSAKMTIDPAGLVSIGPATAAAELHVSKSADGGNCEIILENTFSAGSSTDETTQFQSRLGGYDSGYIVTGKEGDYSTAALRKSYMAFSTRTATSGMSEKLRITSAGDVSVGAVGGATHPKLMLVSGTNSGDPSLQFNNGVTGTIAQIKAMQTSGTVDRLAIGTGTAENLVIDSAGNVGIGCTPTAKFEVEDGGTTAGVVAKITADDHIPWGLEVANDTYTTTDARGLRFYVHNTGAAFINAPDDGSAPGSLSFSTDETTRLTIASDGLTTVTNPGWPLKNELTNSGFDVWSNSTAETVATIAEDDCASDDTADWITVFSALAFDTDHYNYTTTGTNSTVQLGVISPLTLEAGKLYVISCDVKNGLGSTSTLKLRIAHSGTVQSSPAISTTGSFVTHTFTVEIPSGVTAGSVGLSDGTAFASNIEIKNFSFKKITPGCVGANNLAFDTARKDHSGVKIWRQHNDGGTLTHDGSFYSLKMVASAGTTGVQWPATAGVNTGTDPVHLQKYAGRTVTMGAWVKTDQASNAKIRMTKDGYSTNTVSSYHTGGNTWEWLEATMDVGASPTDVRFGIQMDGAGDGSATSNNLTYVSSCMVVLGSAIGSGNYSRPMGEIVWFEKNINSNAFYADGFSDVAYAGLNLEADSNGAVPKGAKAVYIVGEVRDSASASNDTFMRFRADSAASDCFWVSSAGLTNDNYARNAGFELCDSAGDIQYQISASGSATVQAYITYKAVQLR